MREREPARRRERGRAPAPRGAPVSLCRDCGACCSPEIRLPFYVGLWTVDLRRLTPEFIARNVARESLLTKLDPVGNCVCVALQGTLGRRVSCRIYDRRPDACRALEEGSAACHKARRQAGLE